MIIPTRPAHTNKECCTISGINTSIHDKPPFASFVCIKIVVTNVGMLMRKISTVMVCDSPWAYSHTPAQSIKNWMPYAVHICMLWLSLLFHQWSVQEYQRTGAKISFQLNESSSSSLYGRSTLLTDKNTTQIWASPMKRFIISESSPPKFAPEWPADQ